VVVCGYLELLRQTRHNALDYRSKLPKGEVMARIVAVVGSPRFNGNTNYLTDQALSMAGAKGVATEKIILSDYRIYPCQAHDECRELTACLQDDDMRSIVAKVYIADGIILASPVYYYNVSAQMKIFIDRNLFFFRHKQKMQARAAGIIVVAGAAGIEDTAGALVRYITIATNIAADRVMQVRGLAGAEGAIKGNTTVVEQAHQMGRNMAAELQRT